MKLLVGWDEVAEGELIELYLGASGNDVSLVHCADELEALAAGCPAWDAILIPTAFPDCDRAYEALLRIQSAQPECPVIGACYSEDLFRIARFLTHGMRSYVLRDRGKDFVFLLQAAVEGAVQTVQAEREHRLSERLREEIEAVRKLQESIIPGNLHGPNGYSICARYEPSQIRILGGQPVAMAGGDYYDVFTIDENSAVLLVGDASGHGMKACMSIMTMHTLVRMIRGKHYQQTSAFVAEVNRMLSEQSVVTGDGGFITLMYGILHGDRNEFHWTSAGHPVPLLHDLDTNAVVPLAADDPGGVPLGIIPDETYTQCVSRIPPRSRLLLYTDGLVEAFAGGEGDHREFGIDGVIETLRACRGRVLDETLQKLFDASRCFTGGAGRHDDTSVLIVERG
jgi:serine phosphatase RsbU (regulator of sigma subunit)